MNTIEIINITGYLASFFVALAMMFTSIIRLRWFSLVGNLLFTIYGLSLGAYPVAITNALIMGINVYYLIRLYRKEELFRYLEVKYDNRYLNDFLRFHKDDIQKFFPDYRYLPLDSNRCFFILRDMQVAGVIISKKTDENTLEIVLDYTIAQYRDFKPGLYFFHNHHLLWNDLHLQLIRAKSFHKKHTKYLHKIGFVHAENNWFVLRVE
jgi:hypothetical protein